MKRWLARILVCLILGAITTVAVAWGCALLIFEADGSLTRVTERFVILDGSTLHVFAMNRGLGWQWVEHYRRAYTDEVAERYKADEYLHLEQMAEHPCALRDTRDFTVEYNYSFGWPFPSISMYALTSDNVWRIHGELGVGQTHSLPLLPWPMHSLLDSLFYAAIWGAIFFGFTTARRLIRAKRGRCPRCGYDLRGNLDAGCPECGWNRDTTHG